MLNYFTKIKARERYDMAMCDNESHVFNQKWFMIPQFGFVTLQVVTQFEQQRMAKCDQESRRQQFQNNLCLLQNKLSLLQNNLCLKEPSAEQLVCVTDGGCVEKNSLKKRGKELMAHIRECKRNTCLLSPHGAQTVVVRKAPVDPCPPSPPKCRRRRAPKTMPHVLFDSELSACKIEELSD